MKKIVFISLLMIISFNILAQEQKSAKKAMLLSALVPGAGQLYLDNTTKAGIFFASDLLILGSYLRFTKDRSNAIDNYKLLANSQAGLRADASSNLYNLAQKYKSSEIYNNNLEMRARNYFYLVLNDYDRYIEYYETYRIKDEDSWEWTENRHFERYKSVRKDKQTYEIYQNFAFGAILINRLISAVDAVITTNKMNRNSQLYTVPDFHGKGLTLIYEYNF